MTHCKIFDVQPHGDEVRVHGQIRRDSFEPDGRLKRVGTEYGPEFIWYPKESQYREYLDRVTQIDATAALVRMGLLRL